MCKTNIIVSDNVRRYRKELGLSQEKFAEYVDLSMKTIVNIENAKHFPKAKNIDKICEKLNIECYELFIDHNKEQTKNEKLIEINSMLERLDENQIENIYKIVTALSL